MVDMMIVLSIVLYITLVSMILVFLARTKRQQIPKIIWSYWHDPHHRPRVVDLCIESWKASNPDYEIRFMNQEDYVRYIDLPSHKNLRDSPTRFADLLRIYIIEKYGGIWIDSSIVISRPFSEWLFTGDADFYGFYLKSWTVSHPVLENWFFAARPHCRFIRLWRDEFVRLATFDSCDDYLRSRREMGVKFENIRFPNYLAMHVAAQKIMQLDRGKYDDRLHLLVAEETAFRYLDENQWDSASAVRQICDDIDPSPIIKLRGGERHAIYQSGLDVNNCASLLIST